MSAILIASLSRECLVRSGNNKIPVGLGFSRHMKTMVLKAYASVFGSSRTFSARSVALVEHLQEFPITYIVPNFVHYLVELTFV